MKPEELQKIIENALSENLTIPWWVYLLIVVLSFLGSFLGSYFKKKGENLATKEDVEQITKKVESVRHQYSSQL